MGGWDWDSCEDPRLILRLLAGRASQRKFRLAALAVARLGEPIKGHPGSLAALVVAERHAEGEATDQELDAAWDTANPLARSVVRASAWDAAWDAAVLAGTKPKWMERDPPKELDRAKGDLPIPHPDTPKWQCVLLRCLFAHPSRPVRFAPAWRTHDALRLAEAIYADRTFDHLPLLADLLEEAGATDAALLAHLRGPGPHALGCHALDVVLGKE